jgi:arylformamidase
MRRLNWNAPRKTMNIQTPAATARTKGPLVWGELDQKELDDAYDQLVYAPNRDLVVARRVVASDRSRATLGAPQRIAYGEGQYERLDIFRTTVPNAPVNVFVHGGAWIRNCAADYALQAEPLVAAGAHAVFIDFINVEQAGGSLLPMYEQVSRAIAWVWHNAGSFDGDPDKFYISAHSSGSHLAGCALTTGWREQNLPENFCKGALLASGMYELAPVRLSKRSAYVKFTDAMVEKLSAMRHLAGLHTPLIVSHGTCESPEFKRQTREFADATRAAGKSVEVIVGEGYNHFEMCETLANPYGLLGRAVLGQMGLLR